jgi:hypothetical protein
MPKRKRDDGEIRTEKYTLFQRQPNTNPEDSDDESGKMIREAAPVLKIQVPLYDPDMEED